MVDELYIDGVRADLSSDSPIAITYQVNNISELKDRQSTYTNSIKLPLTNTNKKIWGYANVDSFTQQQPYQKLSAKLIRNGVELIVNGVINLKSVSNSFDCQIIYGLIGISDALKKKTYSNGVITNINDAKLVDLDWSDIPSFAFDLPTIVASQSYTGVLWPVIDYGDTLNNTSSINITYLRPGVYFKQIFDRIQRFTGYTFSGGAAWAAGQDDFIPFSDTILKDYLGNPSNLSATPIGIKPNLPDFTVKELLLDYMQRYFLTPVVDNYKKTVVFRSFDELYDNKAKAKNWTKKFVDENRTDEFDLGSYGQLNRLIFLEDSQTPFEFPADGQIYINNENLPASKDMVKSIFAASATVTKLTSKQLAQIRKLKVSPLPNYGVPFTEETKPRVVHIPNAVFGPFTFTSSTSSQVASFIQIGIFRDYNYYIANWGQGFLKLVKKARSITRYAVLTELDVKDFDFFTPVYDEIECQYYYVNQIVNFIPGKKTQLKLIRMYGRTADNIGNTPPSTIEPK